MASISDRVGDLGEYLREQREHAKLSVRQLAALTGVSNPYLSQVERGLRKPSAEVLQQIAKGLRISAEALYVRAGILDEHPSLDVEFAINSDPSLSERQKRVLLDIYTSFTAENARAAGNGTPAEDAATTAARAARRSERAAARAARKRPAQDTAPGPEAAPQAVGAAVSEPAAENGRGPYASTTELSTDAGHEPAAPSAAAPSSAVSS